MHPARSPIAEKDCASEVRTTLINTWGNMFQGGCTNSNCTQLKHAFRRDDVSGTTDTFLELLALPAITATPFCNGNEAQDLDPLEARDLLPADEDQLATAGPPGDHRPGVTRRLERPAATRAGDAPITRLPRERLATSLGKEEAGAPARAE